MWEMWILKFSKIKQTVKKGDIIILLLIVALCFCWFVSDYSNNENLTVTVHSDGKVIYSQSLSSLTEEETVNISGCEIRVSSEGALFHSSDCPDGLCVKRGLLRKNGDVMACVPNMVTVEISSNKNAFDGVSY